MAGLHRPGRGAPGPSCRIPRADRQRHRSRLTATSSAAREDRFRFRTRPIEHDQGRLRTCAPRNPTAPEARGRIVLVLHEYRRGEGVKLSPKAFSLSFQVRHPDTAGTFLVHKWLSPIVASYLQGLPEPPGLPVLILTLSGRPAAGWSALSGTDLQYLHRRLGAEGPQYRQQWGE
jgi:hypothetical protein